MRQSKVGSSIALVFTLLLSARDNIALAATNTPYPAGTAVVVLTPSREIAGTLADINDRDWIAVAEPGAAQATLVRLGWSSCRFVAGGLWHGSAAYGDRLE